MSITAKNILAGKSVLVVEDESLVGLFIQDMLVDIGCEAAGLAAHYEDALEKAQSLAFDVAILDVNLAGRQTFPIAQLISRRGLPFVFATGYGATGIPSAFENVPVVRKPFEQHDLEAALRAALEPTAL
ncbi:MAG TPA: response regulator [Rhizomicrobium sp.]|jgi:CheY-like chemotaxis protein